MADNRYGDYGRREGWRGRDSSIFSDDDDDRSRRGADRWSSDYGRERGGGWSGRGNDRRDWDDGRREELGWGRGRHDQRGSGGGRDNGQDDGRGFFERAGDEVRSWFGDEEAERRRERDMGRDPSGRAFASRDNGGRADLGGSEGRSRYGAGGFGGASFGQDRGAFGGRRSQWDDNYRRWRDQQIAQLDREYEEYCLECQDQFEQDFSSWRTSRLTQGGTGSASDTTGGSSGGAILKGSRSESSGGTGGAETAGATTSAGGTASATESSTGSSGSGGGRRTRS